MKFIIIIIGAIKLSINIFICCSRAYYKDGLRQVEYFTSKTIEINLGTVYSHFLMAALHSNRIVDYTLRNTLFLQINISQLFIINCLI